jgi:hypothetical protein
MVLRDSDLTCIFAITRGRPVISGRDFTALGAGCFDVPRLEHIRVTKARATIYVVSPMLTVVPQDVVVWRIGARFLQAG